MDADAEDDVVAEDGVDAEDDVVSEDYVVTEEDIDGLDL